MAASSLIPNIMVRHASIDSLPPGSLPSDLCSILPEAQLPVEQLSPLQDNLASSRLLPNYGLWPLGDKQVTYVCAILKITYLDVDILQGDESLRHLEGP